jgi:hypothetical protein
MECVLLLRNEKVLRAEEAKYAQESGDDVHQHRQALKDLDAKLQSTEVKYCTAAACAVAVVVCAIMYEYCSMRH